MRPNETFLCATIISWISGKEIRVPRVAVLRKTTSPCSWRVSLRKCELKKQPKCLMGIIILSLTLAFLFNGGENMVENKLFQGKGEADDFKYDPEAEDNNKKYRLPFALCKEHRIAIQDWWTPKQAWQALKNRGVVDDVSDEYKEYYKNLKKDSQKKSTLRRNRKSEQLKNPMHNPDKAYIHEDGKISGVAKGNPMTFEQADSGNVNPHFNDMELIGYKHNCQTCVAVYFARRQGYDVRALPNLNNRNIYQLSHDTSLAFVDEKGNHPNKVYKQSGQRTVDFLEKNVKAGSICSIEFGWRSRSRGHIITAERDENGKLRVYDPQTNQVIKDLGGYFTNTENHAIMDLTNYKLDEAFCDKIMKKKE